MAIHQVSVSGEVKKDVTCAHCGTGYSYVAQRTASGSAVGLGLFSLLDPRFWRYGGYAQLAAVRAERQLPRLLAAAVDAVKCPGCGQLQPNMEAAARAELARARMAAQKQVETATLATLPAGLALLGFAILAQVTTGDLQVVLWCAGIGLVLSLAGGYFATRWVAVRRGVTREGLALRQGQGQPPDRTP